MSRYTMKPKDPNAECVVVGFDRPLRNFFGHLYNANPEGPELLDAVTVIESIEGALAFAARHAEDPPLGRLRELLEEDMTGEYPATNRTMYLSNWSDNIDTTESSADFEEAIARLKELQAAIDKALALLQGSGRVASRSVWEAIDVLLSVGSKEAK